MDVIIHAFEGMINRVCGTKDENIFTTTAVGRTPLFLFVSLEPDTCRTRYTDSTHVTKQ